MSKGIIVEDIPECCDLCGYLSQAYDLEPFEDGEGYCIIKKKSVDEISEGEKPDWCPIRSMPEKKEVCGRYPQPDGVVPSFKMGWNACITEILKGGRK